MKVTINNLPFFFDQFHNHLKIDKREDSRPSETWRTEHARVNFFLTGLLKGALNRRYLDSWVIDFYANYFVNKNSESFDLFIV